MLFSEEIGQQNIIKLIEFYIFQRGVDLVSTLKKENDKRFDFGALMAQRVIDNHRG